MNSGAGMIPNSPIYCGSNPSGSKAYVSSGQYVSPIYQQTVAAVNCYSPVYGQSVNMVSPAYGGVGLHQSGMTNKVSHVSPMYSPTAAYVGSPVYTSANNASKSGGEQN